MIGNMQGVAGILTFIALGLVIYGPWQRVCTDVARQRLFAKRDAIFDLALQGKLDFRSSEYRAIRKTLNDMIRYAHVLTWPRLAWSYFLTEPTGKHAAEAIDTNIAKIQDPQVRAHVEDLFRKAENNLFYMLAAKGVISCAVALLFFLCYIIYRLTGRAFLGQAGNSPEKIRRLIRSEASAAA